MVKGRYKLTAFYGGGFGIKGDPTTFRFHTLIEKEKFKGWLKARGEWKL